MREKTNFPFRAILTTLELRHLFFICVRRTQNDVALRANDVLRNDVTDSP